jgi:Hemopexin
MSTLWFVDGTSCVVTDADDASLYSGELTGLLTGLAGTVFESGIDSALQTEEGTVYLFLGSEYGRYNLSTNALDDGYPKPTADHWPGTRGTPAATQITAAAVLPAWQAVLLCGSDVVPYDLLADKAGEAEAVDAYFAGVPAGTVVTGALTTDSWLYLFAGDLYFRVHPATCIVDGDGDQPLPIEGNWSALAGFTPTGAFTLGNDVTADGLVLSPPPPAGDPYASTPARALTLEQATQVLQSLHDQGALQLAGNASRAWVSLAEARIHDIQFRYWNGSATQTSALRNLDPRNAVGLARLAQWASANYGIHMIAHIGVNGDDTGARTDCHGQGRAVDLAGVEGTRDDGAFNLWVLRDWGSRSVPDENDPSAPRLAKWPPGARPLSYRLDGNPDSSALATEFFAALYDFVASQWQDGDDQPTGAAPTSQIGQRSFVMNPDHPASNPTGKSGREAHANHLHMQIGKTGRQ